jgi:hypothetical protein
MLTNNRRSAIVVNPFVSEAQRRWMWANDPEMAQRWADHTPKGKKLPKKVANTKIRGLVTHVKKKSAKFVNNKTNLLKLDPSRTITLRNAFAKELKKRFMLLKGAVVKLLTVDNVFGITANAFCPTGKGGGVDPTCSPSNLSPSFDPSKLPSIPKFLDPQFAKANEKQAKELRSLAAKGDLKGLQEHDTQGGPKVKGYKQALIDALKKYGTPGSPTPPPQLAPVKASQPVIKPAAVTSPAPSIVAPSSSVPVSAASIQAAMASATQATGMTEAAIKDAVSQDASPKNGARADARAAIESALLKSGAIQDAVLQLQAKGQAERVKEIGTGPALHRAVKEYAGTPMYDLNTLSKIDVLDTPAYGQANCNMAMRTVQMGSKSVTGDFRHELGHALRGSMSGNNLSGKTAMTNAVAKEYADSMAKLNADPPSKKDMLNYEMMETKYGFVSDRSPDTWEEHAAEHYRLYHREIYKDQHEGGKGKFLAQYRERHPGWAKIWDAHYTAALLGE